MQKMYICFYIFIVFLYSLSLAFLNNSAKIGPLCRIISCFLF